MTYSSKQEEYLWKTMEDPGLNCNASRIWLSFTDFQEENVYLNVGNYSYRDVFVDSAIVGNNLTDNQVFWGTNQPNGGVIENCVATQRYRKNIDLTEKTFANLFG